MSTLAEENDSSKQWAKAKEYANKVGMFPSFFSTAMRALVADHFDNNKTIHAVNKFQISRLLKSPSFKSALYYCTLELRTEDLVGRKYLSTGDLMSFHTPLDLAALIFSFVVYRRNKKLVGTGNWRLLGPEIVKRARMGSQVGLSLPEVGMGLGLLASTARYMALSAFLKADTETFKKNQKTLLQETASTAAEFELSHWGCTSSQVMVLMFTNAGFGVDLTQAVTQGIAKECFKNSEEIPLVRHARAAHVWIDDLIRLKKQPNGNLPTEYYPEDIEFQRIMDKFARIEKAEKHWLERSAKDIHPKDTPILFDKPKEEAEFEVPEELADVFTVDELTAIEEDEFDNLIDQIDREAEGKSASGTLNISQKQADSLVGDG